MIKHHEETTSAFYPLPGSLEKCPVIGAHVNKRDSGYGTDCSPASVTSVRRFTYEDTGDCSLSEGVFQLDLNKDDSPDNVFDDCITEGDEADDTDLEVQQLFCDNVSGQGSTHATSQPIQFRPLAPGPIPEDGVAEDSRTIASPYFHTQWTARDRRSRGYGFRPIVSRSVGTQTPSPHSQLIRDALESRGRYQPYARGNLVSRLRFRSDSEEDVGPPLPDLIPMSRDRSVSLPDVPSFRQEHEMHVGRELRRISDEFHSVRVSRRRTISEQPSSFPRSVNISLSATFTQIRRYLSSSPLNQDDPTNDGSRNISDTDGDCNVSRSTSCRHH